MDAQSQIRPSRRKPSRNPSRQPRLGAVAFAAVAAVAGAAIVARGFGVGVGAWGAPHRLAFAAGLALCVAGLYLFQRGLRRQARMRAVEELLPHYRERMRYREMADAQAKQNRWFGAATDWMGDEPEWAEDGGDAPLARVDMRAATRALLVSLEEEMHREAAIRGQRTARPACRRARLRAAGRVKMDRSRRRRVGAPPLRTVS